MRNFKRFLENNSIIQGSFNHLQNYPTPLNLNYFWNFGSLAGFFLSLQIITGIFLSMFYSTDVNSAFSSVEYIMRNINYGWFVRYLHANGASFFFAIIYIHIARGIYYKSYNYNNRAVWFSGIGLFILMMATAFIGYVLPWGQMSFWGATVITNLFSAIPVIGSNLVEWIWGGKSVTGITLRRFFTLHYLFSFIILLFVLVHIANLHEQGSSNPFPEHYRFGNDVIPFYPYYFFKDLVGILIVLVLLMSFVYFNPNYLGHPDNYIEANPLVTPTHIVPEWYFLPFYAILRSISDKLMGVVCMFAAIVSLLLLPHCNYLFRSLKVQHRIKKFTPHIIYDLMEVPIIHKIFSFLFFSVFLLLGWLGAQPIDYPYLQLGIALSHIYFFLLIMLAIF